jgi:hypothetical protein
MTNDEKKIIKAIDEVPWPRYEDIKNAAMEDFKVNFVGTVDQLHKMEKAVETSSKERYRNARKEYNDKVNELEDELKELVRDDFGMAKEVFDILWNKAYEQGHSEGYECVISEAEELYDFVNDIVNAASAKWEKEH